MSQAASVQAPAVWLVGRGIPVGTGIIKPPSRGHWDGGSVKRSSRLTSLHVSVRGNRGETHSLAGLPKHNRVGRIAGK